MIENNPLSGWDDYGLRIRVYVGKSSAKTGHIAAVVGNSKVGYTYYSFGPNGLEKRKNRNFDQLEKEIQKSRGKYPYEEYADFYSTEAQDKKAMEAAEKFSKTKYYFDDSKVCIHLIENIINAAYPDYGFTHRGSPRATFDLNKNNANGYGDLR